MSSQLYDRIGRGYVSRRRADPRIAAAVHAALGDARSVLNVGAGAGAYEPRDRRVLAVEPAAQMRAQRPPGAAACLDATARTCRCPCELRRRAGDLHGLSLGRRPRWASPRWFASAATEWCC